MILLAERLKKSLFHFCCRETSVGVVGTGLENQQVVFGNYKAGPAGQKFATRRALARQKR